MARGRPPLDPETRSAHRQATRKHYADKNKEILLASARERMQRALVNIKTRSLRAHPLDDAAKTRKRENAARYRERNREKIRKADAQRRNDKAAQILAAKEARAAEVRSCKFFCVGVYGAPKAQITGDRGSAQITGARHLPTAGKAMTYAEMRARGLNPRNRPQPRKVREKEATKEKAPERAAEPGPFDDIPGMIPASLAVLAVVPPRLCSLRHPTPPWCKLHQPSGLLAQTEQTLLGPVCVTETRCILLEGDKMGLSTSRTTCLSAKGRRQTESAVIGDFQTWDEVLAMWARHCFHRHGKCTQHRSACVSGQCPQHGSVQPAMKQEVKAVRSVQSTQPNGRREPVRPARRPPPPSYTSESEEDTASGSVPLFDSDTPSPSPAPPSGVITREASDDPEALPRHPVAPSMSSISSASSLSQSSVGTERVVEKGKGRAAAILPRAVRQGNWLVSPPTMATRAIPSTTDKPTKRRDRKVAGKKPGKTSWVHGTKLVFLASRAPDWKIAQELGPQSVSKFYDDVSNLFVHKYGYDMKDEDDLDEDVPDPTDPNGPDADALSLDKEEADRRSAISAQVRSVCVLRLPGHLADRPRCFRGSARGTGHSMGGGDNGQKNALLQLLEGRSEAYASTKPGKQQPWQFYSKLFYEERVKTRFEAAWKVAVQRAKDLEQPAPHDARVRAWEVGRVEIPRSAEEMAALPELTRPSSALNNAGHYLQPLADAIHQMFGMMVAIMLGGPIGKTKGLNPRSWYEFNRMGYRDAEKSMIRFADKCYSEEERRSRAVQIEARASGAALSGPVLMANEPAPPPPRRELGPPPPGGEEPAAPPPRREPAPPLPRRDEPAPPSPRGEEPAPPSPRGEEPAPPSPRGEEPTPTPSSPHGRTPPAPEEQEDGEPAAVVWNRTDKALWPEQLRLGYTAFALGEKWGTEWAKLVKAYLDFEAACGYQDSGPRIDGESKPEEIGVWIKNGRKWAVPPKLRRLGKVGDTGSYANGWWLWWRSLQPERMWVMGMLTWPSDMTWGKLPQMYGRNGFMQIMASLLWWGLEEFKKASNGTESGWDTAVVSMTAVLEVLVAEGRAGPPEKATAKGRKRKAVSGSDKDGETEPPPKNRRTRASGEEHSGPQTRAARKLKGASKAETAAQGGKEIAA
ncbi:hypothetical protein K438DRAFT_1781538 [Mycena galopus ATCC 62051]|nr:hypothetical protein K438DRAFT_1781538 [Mycena galopus ATCC 62051]